MSFEKKRNISFIFTLFFSGIYLFWRAFFTIPWSKGFLQATAGVLLLAAEMVTTLGMFELMISRMKGAEKRLEMPNIPDSLFPHIDVFIATHNEPAELLYKTINACTFMEYPDKSKVHIYVCDDGNREEIKKLAESLGVGYFGLTDNIYAKSGNYNNALSKTSSPLIATFDSDMIPRRKFLVKTVPYFLIPEVNVGLIQTPQSFYNQDLFQFNLFSEKDIPNEQDFFSREINIMRNSSNTAAYTGSNTVILRKAMEEIGGFPYGTITEDFETSLRLQKAGYITYATSEVLAAGLSTTTVKSMIDQRIRWARGVIQSIQNTNAVFTTDLPLAGRISYLNAYLYWWSFFCRTIFIISPILFALFGFQLVECDFWELVFFWFPSHLSYSISVRFLSTNVRNLRWSQIIDTILAPYLIVPVFLESIGIHQQKFKVTDKKKRGVKTTSFKYIIPHGVLIVITLVSIINFVKGKYGTALIYSGVIIFWLCYNLMSLIYAIFFMLGRDSKRKYERIKAEERVEINIGGKVYEGVSIDVSEEGISFKSWKELPVKEGESFLIKVITKYYSCVLLAEMVFIKMERERERERNEVRDGCDTEEKAGDATEDKESEIQGKNIWFYAAVVSPKQEKDKRNWLQVIHDREHSLPKEIDPWMTVYDELYRNIKMRLRKKQRR